MRVFFVTLLLLYSTNELLQAKEYEIKSAKELAALNLKAGDKVILKAGDWKDQKLVFKGVGAEKDPIELIAEKQGQVKLSGRSSIEIDGSWLKVEGLLFADGYLEKDDVILFKSNSSNCRVTNTAIIDFNHPDEKIDYKWVSINGTRNRVDHCYFKGKKHQGVTLVVWLSENPNYHQIDHNYFGPRPELGRNGGETIRIGTSTWSFHDSRTVVENNIFDRCDGELEAVSVKSGKNIIRNNLFYECRATLTLRHGNDSEVSGNYFLGNNKPGTGGVRIIGENHKVDNNYFQELTGTSVSAAISVMAGLPNPQLTSHWQVKNAVITNNTIINCKEPFAIAAGYNAGRYLPALNTTFAKNIIIGKEEPLKWYDDKVIVAFRDNCVSGPTGSAKLPEGFKLKDIRMERTNFNTYKIAGRKKIVPFWTREKVGPRWMKASADYQVPVNTNRN